MLISLGPINENFKLLNFGFIFTKILLRSEISDLVKGENYFNIRYQEKPLMMWIWLSTILIAIGGSVSFFKRYEK